MNVDPGGLVVASVLLMPIGIAIACVFLLERRPRRAPPRPRSVGSVAPVTSPASLEEEPIMLNLDTDVIPALPVREPRLMPPEQLYQWDWPTETPSRLPIGPVSFAQPDPELMKRVVDGLRDLPRSS